jgi:uncharacterized membrane protein YkoI
MRTFQITILFMALSFCGFANAAGARPANLLIAQTSSVSQDQAAAKVRQDTGGRVLDVKTEIQNGVTVYLVKVLLTDGRVRVITMSSQ